MTPSVHLGCPEPQPCAGPMPGSAGVVGPSPPGAPSEQQESAATAGQAAGARSAINEEQQGQDKGHSSSAMTSRCQRGFPK